MTIAVDQRLLGQELTTHPNDQMELHAAQSQTQQMLGLNRQQLSKVMKSEKNQPWAIISQPFEDVQGGFVCCRCFLYLCSQLIGETSANAPPGLRAAMPLFLPCSWRYGNHGNHQVTFLSFVTPRVGSQVTKSSWARLERWIQDFLEGSASIGCEL